MKLTRIIMLLIIASLGAAFFISCTNEGDQLPEYYVLFYVDGEKFVFDMGHSDIEDTAFASQIEQDPDDFVTRIYAAPEDLAGKDQSESTYISFQVHGTITGTYVNNGNMYCYFAGTPSVATEFTITISEYGDVGGIIAGTLFSTSGSLIITDGEFRVIRAADGSYIIWPPE